jgi:hypothetical protein
MFVQAAAQSTRRTALPQSERSQRVSSPRDCQVRTPDHQQVPILQSRNAGGIKDLQTGFGIERNGTGTPSRAIAAGGPDNRAETMIAR